MSFKVVVRKNWRYVVASLALLVGVTILSQKVFASNGRTLLDPLNVPVTHSSGGFANGLMHAIGGDTLSGSNARCPGFTSGPGVCDHTQQSVGGAIIDTTDTDTPTSTSTPSGSVTPTPSIAGDANSDNVVDGIDFSILKAYFGQSCGGDPLCARADFNYDGVVNSQDLHVILVNFGKSVPPDSPVPPSSGDAFLSLQPGIAGNCSAPPNGGTVLVGCRFVLDMMVNMGSVPDGVAMQSYMTFTSSILQNARVSSIASSCVPTNTVVFDLTTFDAALQSEVCNGPALCTFRGITRDAGSLAYAAGDLVGNCPTGCGGTFRVAQTGWCAVAPGQAVLHWQFSPPAPRNRHTAIVDVNGNMVQALVSDYVINVLAVSPTPTPVRDAFMVFVPEGSAPPNGGTVTVGDRFVLDLMLNSGTHDNVTAQQSYLTYTYNLIQNARVDQIDSACVLTRTVTSDFSTFDASLQNEVCNGPGQCNFRGSIVDPGSFAYASGGSVSCVGGCGGTFRVAQVGLCAVAPGQAVLHWQFTPPAPIVRDSEIVAHDETLIHNPALYTDYVINIVAPTSTPTPTLTPGIMGHGTWEGRQPQPDPSQILPISLTLRLTTGGPYYDYPLQNTNASGLFTVSVAGLPNGTYTWRAKGPQFLANAGTITLAGGPVTNLEAGLLRAGDANGDNAVNVSDFNVLRGSFGKSCGDVGYDDRADFSGDCTVNIVDFNLMKRNFGLSGANPLTPGGP